MQKMQRNRKHHKRLNNRGMSLVEVVIAMAILSVVVVAVLQSLTMSMVYSKKARVKQDTTLKGESIMEIFKGYNMADLYDMFKVSSPVEAPAEESTEPAEAPAVNPLVTMIGAGKYSVTGEDPRKNASADLEFKIENLEIKSTNAAATESEKYDVLIKATHVTPAKTFQDQKLGTSGEQVFISNEEYDDTARQNAFDEFMQPSSAKLTEFINFILDKYPNSCDENGKPIDENYIKTHLSTDNIFLTDRETVVSLEDGQIVITMDFKYRIYGFEIYEKEYPEAVSDTYDDYDPEESPEGETSESETSEEKEEIPDAYAGKLVYIDYPVAADGETEAATMTYRVALNTSAAEEEDKYKKTISCSGALERFYFYFYPQYEERSRIIHDDTGAETGLEHVKIRDSIKVSNTRSDQDVAHPVECFLIKQRRNDLSDANIKTKEGGYSLNVTTEGTAGATKIYDNLEDKLDSDGIKKRPTSPSGNYYMNESLQKDETVAYMLELTITKDGKEVTKLKSSKNER